MVRTCFFLRDLILSNAGVCVCVCVCAQVKTSRVQRVRTRMRGYSSLKPVYEQSFPISIESVVVVRYSLHSEFNCGRHQHSQHQKHK